MLLVRLPSSTNLSGQRILSSSSLSTRCPRIWTSTTSVSKTIRVNGTGLSSRNRRRSVKSRRNRPNSYKWLCCLVISPLRVFRELSENFLRTSFRLCQYHSRLCQEGRALGEAESPRGTLIIKQGGIRDNKLKEPTAWGRGEE